MPSTTGSPGALPPETATRLAEIDAALCRPRSEVGDGLRADLHREAAFLMRDPAARRFQITHAWIYALSAGSWDLVDRLEHELREMGGL